MLISLEMMAILREVETLKWRIISGQRQILRALNGLDDETIVKRCVHAE